MAADEDSHLVVDLSCFESSATEDELLNIGEQIVEAFQGDGFVYLKNHGLTAEDLQNFVEASDQFFDLEEDVKLKYIKKSFYSIHGYSTEKHEIADTAITAQSKAGRNAFDILSLEEPFPDQEVPQFKLTAKNILDKFLPTVVQILRSLELALGMKNKTLVDSHKLMMNKGNLTELKSVLYLPPSEGEQVNRLESHFDFSTITFQLYSDLEGLEILDKDGQWQKQKRSPECILLFPSEIIQMWTGDKIKATKHKVVIPEAEETRRLPRHSVILFVFPDDHIVIEPLDGDLKKYKPVTVRDFTRSRINVYYKVLLDGK